ncbi:MAG: hypothetical protein E6R09_13750 [Rhodocyclaceae bacterium]|nr:MAG: hypothetical protein E6R09_13750 [Rhodocyclaceae bacterium]
MTAPWQKTFRAFAGPGIDHPSTAMRVDDDEAAAILADLGRLDWSAPVHVGSGRHAGYAIHHAREASVTALFGADGIVGFYAGSYLWIAREHRGLGLSTPLILAAAEQRGGSVLPPGVVVQGYTPAGLAAHRTAYDHAVLTAIAASQPVVSRSPRAFLAAPARAV